MLQLYPYQRAGIDALYDYWQNGGGNGLLVYPTASGKSLIAASLIKELLTQWPGLRIAIVTHVRELISQNLAELKQAWPEAPAGVYSAGLKRREHQAQILFCGIQSVWDKVDKIGAIDVLIVDECHLISKNADTMYGKFIERLRTLTPDMRVVGLTATPYRLDSGMLHEGEDALFDDIVYDCNIGELIAGGYICPLISKATKAEIDVRGVATRGGEYVPDQLQAAAMRGNLVESAVAEIVAYGAERKGWIAFATGVKHAFAICNEIRKQGFSCETLTAKTPSAERDRMVNQFKAGDIRCLTSVGVLSTGFNAPHVDLIALMRPTKSPGLFVQQVGRGFRKAEGKKNCLVLDFAGLCRMHGPIDEVEPPKEKDKDDKRAKAKECPQCSSYLSLAARVCDDCGFEFRVEPRVIKHATTADSAPILSSERCATWVPVSDVSYFYHYKDGKPPSLRVEYYSGMLVFREWVTLEHLGYPHDQAMKWWRIMSGSSNVMPVTVGEALTRTRELTTPTHICIRPDGKYQRVCGYRLARANEILECNERLRVRRWEGAQGGGSITPPW